MVLQQTQMIRAQMIHQIINKPSRHLLFTLFLSSSIFISCSTTCNTEAEPITTWVDEDGVRHFSTKEDTKSQSKGDSVKAESAELPDIKKYDSDSRIESLREVSSKTCVNRGGVDCEAGQTESGGVICADGYKESLERFEGTCTQIRLVSSLDLPQTTRSNKHLMNVPIKVSIRNESRIQATNVAVKTSFPESLSSDKRYELLLEGPDSIAPFEVAHYTYTGKMIDLRIARRGNVKVSCTECWNPLSEKNKVELKK